VEVHESIVNAPVRPDIIHRVVVWQEKNNRTTMYKAKKRSEVSGGGRKPWKQKGTGKARAGSNRSPLWVGGGVAHGPKLRDWGIKLQRKVRQMGMRIALAAKLRDGRLCVVKTLEHTGGSQKTKDASKVLGLHGVAGRRTLWIGSDDLPESFQRSMSAVPRTTVMKALGANVADLIMAERVFITPEAWASVSARIIPEA
jgi:large subunit ribosomal protein L4